MRIFKLSIALLSGLFLAFSPIAFAKVTGNTITLGSAISFTGKYSSNGIHASNGYNLGVKRVNEMGGVKVGERPTCLRSSIMMMNPLQHGVLS